jgi:hypothetical protein
MDLRFGCHFGRILFILGCGLYNFVSLEYIVAILSSLRYTFVLDHTFDPIYLT